MLREHKKVECPYCGYKMPIIITEGAQCKGLRVKCKGKNCKKEFDIVVP